MDLCGRVCTHLYFAIIGGTFADRWRPKRTMVWCDLLSSLSAVVVLVALMFGPWYSVLLGTLVSAVFSQFSQPSAMKLFKQHVPGEGLQGVMAMFQTMVAVFMVVGPMIGTVIYQNYGIEVSLVLTAVMFLLSGLVLSRLPKDEGVLWLQAFGAPSIKSWLRDFDMCMPMLLFGHWL